jgi:hypothetical protein
MLSRFDYCAFGWLLPKEIHAMISDYCRTGIEPSKFAFEKTEAVGEDVTSVDYDNRGELMMAINDTWHELSGISTITEDCAGYYLVIMSNAVAVLRPDFTIHSKLDGEFAEIALFQLRQTACTLRLWAFLWSGIT